MNENMIKEKFLSILDKYVGTEEEIDFDKSLSEYELDSFIVIQLIVDLEIEFEIEFPDYVMVPEMFETAGTLYRCFFKVVTDTLEKY